MTVMHDLSDDDRYSCIRINRVDYENIPEFKEKVVNYFRCHYIGQSLYVPKERRSVQLLLHLLDPDLSEAAEIEILDEGRLFKITIMTESYMGNSILRENYKVVRDVYDHFKQQMKERLI